MAAGAQNLQQGAQNLFGYQQLSKVPTVGVQPVTPAETFRQQEAGTFGSPTSVPTIPVQPEVITQADADKIAIERQRQEKINQDKMNKMMELATMGDDRQATAPRPQMVGAGSGMRNFQPIASGPLKRPDDILNTPFLQGLYS